MRHKAPHRWITHAAFVACGFLPASALAADVDVDQQGIRFSQPEITLKVGDTLHFHNHDDVTHNIMIIDSDDDAEDQGMQKPGHVISKQFTEEGTFEARCAIHPKMKMIITVGK
jgi:plastocyanin